MACTTPSASITLGANTLYPNCTKIPFWVSAASNGLVTLHIALSWSNLAVFGGVQYWLLNAAGDVLINGDTLPFGSSSIVWNLGSDDPHTLYLQNTKSTTVAHVPVSCSYSVVGGCTQSQGIPPGCIPNPCPSGCTCYGQQGGTTGCNCPKSCPALCPAHEYCDAATGFACKACSPACPAGAVCGPHSNTCTCPAGKCCPPCVAPAVCTTGQGGATSCVTPSPTCNPACTGGRLCLNGTCQCPAGEVWNGTQCVSPNPNPGPSGGPSTDLLIAGGGLAALLGAFWLTSRNRPAAQPVGAGAARPF